MAKVLIVDDDEAMRYTLSAIVEHSGNEAVCAPSLEQGLQTASSMHFELIMLDVMLPDGNGLLALPKFRRLPPRPEIIIITGYGSADGAELAVHSGAWDYIQKGSTLDQMRLAIMRALEYRKETKGNRVPAVLNREGIIGSSDRLGECLELLAQAATSDGSVLITGDTGTGKELFARAIHKNSKRKSRDFVVVDCAALPENLVESVLFGHEKGSFTGADKAREGLIKQADGGTLFLDEVGELPVRIQRAFLRVLQEHSFRPIGAKKEVYSDFRLISATNRDLNKMVSQDHFRADLLFRLQSLTIDLPPLKERSEDVEELARYYIDKLCLRYGLKAKTLSHEFLEALKAYDWPGNVRELINAMETAVSMGRDLNTLYRIHLPTHIRAALARASVKVEQGVLHLDLEKGPAPFPDLRTFLQTTERQYIEDILTFVNWDIKKACSVSGLSRSRFYDRLKKYQIPRPRSQAPQMSKPSRPRREVPKKARLSSLLLPQEGIAKTVKSMAG